MNMDVEKKFIKSLSETHGVKIVEFFEKKVFLEIFVKVEKDWRNRDKQLKSFGYDI